MREAHEIELFSRLWSATSAPTISGEPRPVDSVDLVGTRLTLPSVYAVSDFAVACIAVATTAVADVAAQRTGQPAPRARIDRGHAAAAFRSERYLEGLGWTIPDPWDPIAGDYPTTDGFIRLHTNYSYHRAAVLRALGTDETRDAVARAVASWNGDALEDAVIGQGGCAAKLRTAVEFDALAAGQASSCEPLVEARERSAPLPHLKAAPGGAPLAGIRVLDLTRVLAGPVCTRLLASYGAEVLRLDPPGFAEVPTLLLETTAGKRRAALDLRTTAGRATFEELVRNAHVLVTGYRADALPRLGFGEDYFQRKNPALITIALDAYGWSGPWSARRGFDSLVQMSTGIAARGQEVMRKPSPHPLPAQVLDHATGYLAAAAALRALSRLITAGVTRHCRLSLVATARCLMSLGDNHDPREPDFGVSEVEAYRETVETPWGPLRRVRCAGELVGYVPRLSIPPGPLATDNAEYRTESGPELGGV